MAELVALSGWTVRLGRGKGAPLLDGLDLAIAEGEAVALVGPSGSGKSLTALSLCGLLPRAVRTAGTVRWEGRPIGGKGGPAWSAVRGAGLTLVGQEPAQALNPVLRVGDQVAETVRRRDRCSRPDAVRRTLDLLHEVGLPDPGRVSRSWPHELSGGMQQRAVLAAALACRPRLLVADEPTTSLDPTIQAAVLARLDALRRAHGMALLFITHDPHLVPLLADRQVGLASGRIVSDGPAPAARAAAVAGPAAGAAATVGTGPSLVARGVVLRHPGMRDAAVAGVDLELAAGEIVGLAGESGSGKTTLARLLTGHLRPDAGSVELAGEDLGHARGARIGRLRRRAQLLFQNAGGSLDPRQDVASALAEAAGRAVDAAALLAEVGLPPDFAGRLPHQMSGGQRQRVALARCLAAEPWALVADEPTAALDPETRARLVARLVAAARVHSLALLVVSHDLDVLRGVCDRIVVMLGGVVVEQWPRTAAAPRHPYTRSLLSVQPSRLVTLGEAWRDVAGTDRGEGAADLAGCPFRRVCPLVKPICHKGLPGLSNEGAGHLLRCPPAADGHAPQFIDTL